MKIKNQSSIPSKYWLAIIAVICVILLGIDQVTDGGGPLRFIGAERYQLCWKMVK